MNSEIASRLFNLCFISLSAASLVFVFVAEGIRRDLAGISRAIVLRLGPVAIVSLLIAAAFALVGSQNPSVAQWAIMVTLGLLLFGVACLFSLGLYFMRVTFTLVHLDTMAMLLTAGPSGWLFWQHRWLPSSLP